MRKHLTYANVMATIAVFGVLAGGGAYAASKIDTPDIANKAVTAAKLDSKAVTKSKLDFGAVTGNRLADGAVETRNLSQSATVPVAGVTVIGGEVHGSFNRLIGLGASGPSQPTVEHTGPGVYSVYIPGTYERSVADDFLLSATLTGKNVAPPGEITTRWEHPYPIDTFHPLVFTYDSSGDPADRDFTFLMNRVDHH
jgi:hypothetical protein